MLLSGVKGQSLLVYIWCIQKKVLMFVTTLETGPTTCVGRKWRSACVCVCVCVCVLRRHQHSGNLSLCSLQNISSSISSCPTDFTFYHCPQEVSSKTKEQKMKAFKVHFIPVPHTLVIDCFGTPVSDVCTRMPYTRCPRLTPTWVSDI